MQLSKAKYLMYGVLLITYLIPGTLTFSEETSEIFPTPPPMHTNVAFWKRVYTEITNGTGFIHDLEHLDIVYEIYPVPEGSRQHQSRKIRDRVAYFQDQLATLAGNPDTDNPQLKKIAALWKNKNPTSDTYRLASQNVRFQRGQKDRFLEGIRRSKNYLAEMNEIVREEEVPGDFVYLPHVESSFDCNARSSRGAVGMWQFIYETGKRYMSIDRLIDERKDPLISTRAATQLLKNNYLKLQSWPLALIAYNYGTNGLVRATKKHNTNNLEYILDNHKTRRFGFAAKNFYAEFLAAREIAKNPTLYFNIADKDGEYPEINIIYLKNKTSVKSIMREYGITADEFLKYNPAITLPVIHKNYQLKEGFPIYLPKAKCLAISREFPLNGASAKD